MLLLWIPAVLFLLYFAVHLIYRHFCVRDLHVELEFLHDRIPEEGESVLLEKVSNRGLWPLPVLILSFKTGSGLTIDHNRNASVTDMVNVTEYFSLSPREEISRRHPVESGKRGIYLIEEVSVTLPSFFTDSRRFLYFPQMTRLTVCPRTLQMPELRQMTERIFGDYLTDTRLYQDVFSFRGIREYVPGDPLNAINWKASARTGQYMVNQRDYTAGREVVVLLNLDPPSILYSDTLMENDIRVAMTVFTDCIGHHIPVSLVTNGLDYAGAGEIRLDAGCSPGHLQAAADALAGIRLPHISRTFDQVLEEIMAGPAEGRDTFCLISSNQGDPLIRAAEGLVRGGRRLYWICPADENTMIKPVPSIISFQAVLFKS